MKRIFIVIIIFIGMLYLLYEFLPTYSCRNKRVRVNENAAISSHIPALFMSQQSIKKLNLIDADNNEIGEYANASELINYTKNSSAKSLPSYFYYNYKKHNKLGADEIGIFSGYIFRICIPDSISLAEKHWCCFAYPSEYSKEGKNTFFINEKGKIWQSAKEIYGMNLNKIPQVKDAYKGEPFVSVINDTIWKSN